MIFRHSFAVRTLIDWQRSGVDIDGHIGVLSTYLGHVSPADTYWYLSASPELMALAAERLDARYGAHAMTALAPTLQAFFTDRLIGQRAGQPEHHRRLPRHLPAAAGLRRRRAPARRRASWTSPTSTPR